MYSVNSLRVYFGRRPEFGHRAQAVMAEAVSRADPQGLIAAGADWSWLDDYLRQDFFAECERDPLGLFGADIERLGLQPAFLRLDPMNFPTAKDGEVVLEGSVGIVLGGIPGVYNWDTEVISEITTEPHHHYTYWHPQLLRGWSGTVQVVMQVSDQGLRDLIVRRPP